MSTSQPPALAYLESLLAGEERAALGLFAGVPRVDDPLDGSVRGEGDFRRFLGRRHSWLAEREAALETLRSTRGDGREVFEGLLQLEAPRKPVELPLAVVGDLAGGGQIRALRVYHSLWPLRGQHKVRAPLLPEDPTIELTDVIAEYQQALAKGDAEAIVATFEEEGYFREPAGGGHIFRGREELGEFMSRLLAAGGIGLEHCTVTDDGIACAIEFNAVRFGSDPLEPQAGVAVYERGASGRLHAARIYDDVNVEALAASSG